MGTTQFQTKKRNTKMKRTELNVADLVASVKNEVEEKKIMQKTAGLTGLASLSQRMAGGEISKEAEDANFVAAKVAEEIGVENLPLSQKLEKVAADMEGASTTEEIIKIASDLDNSDLAHISTIASKLADVVWADLQNKIDG
jgi:hypothetical protein